MKMHIRVVAAVLFVALVAVGVHAAPIPAYTADGASTGGAGPSLDIGRQFIVSKPITVYDLGVYNDHPGTGLTDSHIVDLFSLNHTGQGATGTLISGVNVPAGTAATLIDGFRYEPLSSPITLAPGDYAVIAYGLGPGGDPYGDQPEPPSTIGRLNGASAKDAGFDPYVIPSVGSPFYPPNGDTNNHAGASFTYVPEPGSCVLLALGAVGLLLARRRRG